jgi:hypothetical protein
MLQLGLLVRMKLQVMRHLQAPLIGWLGRCSIITVDFSMGSKLVSRVLVFPSLLTLREADKPSSVGSE